MAIMVRQLLPVDWSVLRTIRLEALAISPDGFGSTYEEEKDRTEAEWRHVFERESIFAAFVDGCVGGIIALMPHQQQKYYHRGTIFSVYVSPTYRCQGIGGRLLDAVMLHAKSMGLLQIQLGVRCDNEAAIACYTKKGFVKIGHTPRSSFTNGAFHDEQTMMVFLDGFVSKSFYAP
ncbi:MAG: hypothetical protein QG604_767 [Candidatus Dependentiae bacterium]|nr:hypothetical protein [Candidatus Dependentiae bacterium]